MAEVDLDAPSPRWPARAAAALAVLAAGALYVWLSMEHAASLRLTREAGEVFVEAGRWAPMGWARYAPSTAFAPVAVGADSPARLGECADLRDCEDRLFEVALHEARRALERPGSRAQAPALIQQAARLAGPERQDELLGLQGDGQHLRGLAELEEAAAALERARVHFARAQALGSPSFPDAAARVEQVERLLSSLRPAPAAPSPVEPAPTPSPPVSAPPVSPEQEL
jgi:hypothetical protein